MRIKKTIPILFVFTVIIGFLLIYPAYKSYSYYKSQRFANTAYNVWHQFYGMFLERYYRQPIDGSEFLDFCEQEFLRNYGLAMDETLLNDGIKITEDKIEKKITIISLGEDGIVNEAGLSLYPSEMSFPLYLFRQNDIIIGCFETYTFCDIRPKLTEIYKKGKLLEGDDRNLMVKHVNVKVDSFSNGYFEKRLYATRRYDTTSLYLKATIFMDSVNLAVVCDPYEKYNYDYSKMLEGLSRELFNDEQIKEKVDSLYFLLKIDTSFFEKDRTNKNR